MNPTWSHHNPVRILAGRGCLEMLEQEVTDGHWLLVTTAGATRRCLTEKILNLLPQIKISVCDGITPNPELDHLDQLTAGYRSQQIDGLIALGGGSVMDAAKVLSVTLPSELEKPLATSLREGKGQAWNINLPVIAIPTTSGTGAEVTPFATVWDQSEHKKHSVTGDCVYPILAVMDPELTLTLPHDETLYTGLDAISHALESLWNKNKTPVSEAWAWQALELANKALPIALKEPANLDAREKMQQASLLAGLAISQTRTAIAHSISYPLTSHYGVPHGLACSFTLLTLIRMWQKEKTVDQNKTLEQTKKLLKRIEAKKLIFGFASKKEVMMVANSENKDRTVNTSFAADQIKVIEKSIKWSQH
ncbi:phosphonoacetaldehyde reductase [Marinospirillum alkaliphilum]|uniref:Alcohol dehydrogenase n=1 Tax=Marinospirillum alkaliphilum DSM 21637 TaxID=1122209 RepID=A0A1K1VK66_9GAMM|nr:phosphonoacetaldehyde reductase [Marinospirillum alkaliphilum]SFX25076.1 alcohol dehydrogenase [Marinospirillum alkaliphilum DSM 21637]